MTAAQHLAFATTASHQGRHAVALDQALRATAASGPDLCGVYSAAARLAEQAMDQAAPLGWIRDGWDGWTCEVAGFRMRVTVEEAGVYTWSAMGLVGAQFVHGTAVDLAKAFALAATEARAMAARMQADGWTIA